MPERTGENIMGIQPVLRLILMSALGGGIAVGLNAVLSKAPGDFPEEP